MLFRSQGPIEGPGISVKLSALHPRYEFAQRERVLAELTPRLVTLAAIAKDKDVGLTIDAEEADRLDLSLDIFDRVSAEPRLRGWDGLGLAVPRGPAGDPVPQPRDEAAPRWTPPPPVGAAAVHPTPPPPPSRNKSAQETERAAQLG